MSARRALNESSLHRARGIRLVARGRARIASGRARLADGHAGSANVDLNRNLVRADARDATSNGVGNLRANELVAADVLRVLNRLHDRIVDGAGLGFRNATRDAAVDRLRNGFGNATRYFVAYGAGALLGHATGNVVDAGLRFGNDLAALLIDGAGALLRYATNDVVDAGLRFRNATNDVVAYGAGALLGHATGNVVDAGLRFGNDLAALLIDGAGALLRYATGNVVGADFRLGNHLADAAGYRTVGGLRNHAGAGNFAHAGLGNPNFTSASGRRALNGADLEGLARARIARVAASDAAIDGAAGNRVALILPASGGIRNLAGVGLGNHDGAGNLTLDGLVARTHDRVGALTLLGRRNHNGVVDLLRHGNPIDAINGISARALLGNRNHDRVRNFLLAGLVDDAINRSRNRLRNVFPNGAIDRVGNLASLTLGHVTRACDLARNRNLLDAVAVADDLLFFKDDSATGLHDRIALRGEFTRGRTASGVGTRAAVSRLRLLQRERCQRGNR